MQIILSVLLGLILSVGRVESISAQETPPEKLSSELFQLVEAKNPKEFAEEHGIPIINSSVKVTIVTTDGFPDITERYNLKEAKRHKNLIQAIVSIEDLVSLSKEKEVKYIRRPHKFWKWPR